MLELVKQLKRNGLKLAILSNASYGEAKQLRKDYWIDIFDYTVMSSETGYSKPQAEAFLDVSENLQTDPDDCLFIDDETYRLTGAREIGMMTHHFTDQQELESELSVLGLIDV